MGKAVGEGIWIHAKDVKMCGRYIKKKNEYV
jgi:hypothetical protein